MKTYVSQKWLVKRMWLKLHHQSSVGRNNGLLTTSVKSHNIYLVLKRPFAMHFSFKNRSPCNNILRA